MNLDDNDTEAWIRMITSKPEQNGTLAGVGVHRADNNEFYNATGNGTIIAGQDQLNAVGERNEALSNGEGQGRRLRRNSLPSNSLQFSPYWNAGRTQQVQQNQMNAQLDNTVDQKLDLNTGFMQRTRSSTFNSSDNYNSYSNNSNYPPESPILSKSGSHRQSTGQIVNAGPIQQQFGDSQYLNQPFNDFTNNRPMLSMNNDAQFNPTVSRSALMGGDVDYYNNLPTYNGKGQGFVMNNSGFEPQSQNDLSKLLNSIPYANGMDGRVGPSPQIFGSHQQMLGNQQQTHQGPAQPVAEKQPHSYASLIGMAILNSNEMRLTLSEIYAWINEKFPFFKKEKSGSWQSSVRHNLTFNESFVKKVVTTADGKRNYWTVDPECRHYFSEQGEYIRHRGRRNKAAAKDKTAKDKAAKDKKAKAKSSTKDSGPERKMGGKAVENSDNDKKTNKNPDAEDEDPTRLKLKHSRPRKVSEAPSSNSGLSSFEELSTSKGKRHRANPESALTAVARTQSLDSISNSQLNSQFPPLPGNTRISILQGKSVLPTVYSGMHLDDSDMTQMPEGRCSMPMSMDGTVNSRRASAPDMQEDTASAFDDMVQELSLGGQGFDQPSFPLPPNVDSLEKALNNQRPAIEGGISQMRQMNPGEDPNYTWLSTMSASQKQGVPLPKYEPLFGKNDAQTMHLNTHQNSHLDNRLSPRIGAAETGLEQLYRDANGFLNSL